MEIWKDIQDYEGLYQVSSIGNVKSLSRTKGKRTVIERIVKTTISSFGYKRVVLSKDSALKTFCNHRLVAIAFIPNPDNKQTVNHINGVKTDNRVENLEWSTQQEQISHAIKIGLHHGRPRRTKSNY